MLSGGRIGQLMYCWKVAVAIIATLTVVENYLVHGAFFTQFTISDEKPPDGYTLSGERVKLYLPEPTPLKHNDVVLRTSTTLDVLLVSRIDDHWKVNGGRELTGQ